MEDNSAKTKKRKRIRHTEDFSHLDRKSLAISPPRTLRSGQKISKKNKALPFLPTVYLEFGNKENSSPINTQKIIKSRKSKIHADSKISNEEVKKSECVKKRSRKVSSVIEEIDSEITFQRKLKKKKIQSVNSDEISNPFIFETAEIENHIKKVRKEKRTARNSTPKSASKEFAFSDSFKLSEGVQIDKHLKNKGLLSAYLPPTPVKDEELSDDVFSESPPKLSETFECTNNLTSDNDSEKRNTYELKNSYFDVSELPLVESVTENVTKSQINKKSVNSNSTKKRSRSWSMNENAANKLNKRSVSFMTDKYRKSPSSCLNSSGIKIAEKSPVVNKVSNSSSVSQKKLNYLNNNSSAMKNTNKSSAGNLSIIPFTSRKSVRFSTVDVPDRNSSMFEDNNSKSYPKSPHAKKLSSTFNFSKRSLSERTKTPVNDTFEEISAPTSLENKVTKRRKWDKSLGVSVLDSSGFLHSISPPWEETDSFSFGLNSNKSSIKTNTSEQIFELSPNEKNASMRNVSEQLNHLIKSEQKVSEALSKKMSALNSSLEKSEKLNSSTLASSPTVTFLPSKKAIKKDLANVEKKSVNKKMSPAVTLLTSKNAVKKDLDNVENKIVIKKTKIPNFALIHRKAFDKMENLKDMSERKARRAQELLSGKKPTSETNMKVSDSKLKVKQPVLKIKSPKSRKLLRYSPKRKSLEKLNKSGPSLNNLTITKEKIAPSTSNPTFMAPKYENKSHIPKPKNTKENQKKVAIGFGSRVGLSEGKRDKPLKQQQVQSVANKTSTNEVKRAKALKQQQVQTVADKTNVSQVKRAKALKQQEIQSVANKTSIKRNSLEARRNVVQNVRSNRRFELLMKMRNSKN